MAYAQTIIVGSLGGDPELKYLQSGKAVCNFSVAVTEKWKDRQTNEQKEKTTWYRVAVWGPQAEACNTYLEKGKQVMVVGNVTARGYMSNGEAKASLDLTAREVKFLGGAGGGGGRRNSQRPTNTPADKPKERPGANMGASSVDDIPFAATWA